MRLDFESFTLLGPLSTDEAATTGGMCARDTFKVTVSIQSVPVFGFKRV